MSDNALIPFEFEDRPIRIIRDENGDPWFVAADVCAALGITNTRNATARLDDDEKGVRQMDTLGGNQDMVTVTESGLYSLILRSDKPQAKAFKRWITHEVLPTIRKTGQYSTKSLSLLEQLEATVAILRDQQAQLTEHSQRLHALESHVQGEPEHFTILGYCKLRSLPVPSRNEAQSMGQRAVKLSRAMGQSIGKTTDPRYGTVNTYHISVLDELYKKVD